MQKNFSLGLDWKDGWSAACRFASPGTGLCMEMSIGNRAGTKAP
jgi:hypothetical protein